MAQDIQKMVDRLNKLIVLDEDAIGAYQSAIDRIEIDALRMRLSAFKQDHERHVQDLQECVAQLGGEPREGADWKGAVLKGFTAVTSMMGTEAALRAMEGNEELTNRTYREALEEIWPEGIRAVIEGNYDDERRHLDYIQDAIRDRLWESPVVTP